MHSTRKKLMTTEPQWDEWYVLLFPCCRSVGQRCRNAHGAAGHWTRAKYIALLVARLKSTARRDVGIDHTRTYTASSSSSSSSACTLQQQPESSLLPALARNSKNSLASDVVGAICNGRQYLCCRPAGGALLFLTARNHDLHVGRPVFAATLLGSQVTHSTTLWYIIISARWCCDRAGFGSSVRSFV